MERSTAPEAGIRSAAPGNNSVLNKGTALSQQEIRVETRIEQTFTNLYAEQRRQEVRKFQEAAKARTNLVKWLKANVALALGSKIIYFIKG